MKQETSTNKIEREYVIPLRNKCKRVPRYKKTNKAIRTIREFLVKHMKIRDRDLNKIKIDKYLNEEIWFRGIKKPPARIKVKAIKEGDIVKVELFEFPENLKFKKAKEEEREKMAAENLKKKKKVLDKLKEQTQKKEEENKDSKIKEGNGEEDKEKKPEVESKENSKEEKKEENKEKKSGVVESMQKMEKDLAKKSKHIVGGKTKQPKHQIRKALNK